uniref:ABC transporter permease n=1 Tax=Pararhizobium sp. IMCC3301 TaxID=3067904 RepID=UPI0027418AF0|nr:ABC transporter permease [Pararhizobium sp. IMCC3301]
MHDWAGRYRAPLYILRRLLSAIPTLLAVLTVIFFAIRTLPGDPALAILGDSATDAAIAGLREKLGLNLPVWRQYLDFLGGLLRGDLGTSLVYGRGVLSELLRVLPYTLALTLASIVIGTVIGIPLGIISALHRNRLIDYITRVLSLLGFSFPVFYAGIMLILIFAVWLPWFPVISSTTGGFGTALHGLVLPAVAGSLGLIAMITRASRSSLLDVLGDDYIRTARAKGLPEKTVLYRHALRNALIPVVTVIGLYFALIIGNSVLIETVFTRPGLGSLIIGSLDNRDYPMVQGLLVAYAAIVIIVNLLTDLTYSVIDPRIGQS